MSASVYGLVFRSKIGNSSLKLVLLALADNANDDGYCFPGLKHLIAKTELSKRQILRCLDTLKESNLIRHESGSGRGNFSEYWIDLERVEEKVPIQQKGDILEGKRCQIGKEKVPNRFLYKEETSLETSVEPLLCSEPPRETPKLVVITLPLNNSSEFPIEADHVSEWTRLYPSVNVEQELRTMRGWCLSNPAKRKTKGGILRFVNTWLARKQDQGGTFNAQPILPVPKQKTANQIWRESLQ